MRASTRHRQQRSGFTLVELVLSMSIATILMGGIATAMTLASRAIPSPDTPQANSIAAFQAAEEIAGDLYTAESFTERSATAVTFTVADRDSDLTPESIRFAWSGTPGDPLMRTYNGTTATVVADNVHELDLTYTIRTISQTVDRDTTLETAEMLLASFDGWSGVTPTAKTGLVGPGSLHSQYLEITPQAEATEMKITRAMIFLSLMSLPPTAVQVEIRRSTQDGNYEPAATPIGSPALISGGLLSVVSTWQNADFSDVVITDPTRTDYCIVVSVIGATPALLSSLYAKTAPDNGMYYRWSDDGGASWDPRANTINQNDMRFYVYGTFTTGGTQTVTVNRDFVKSATITMRVGSDSKTRVQTSVQILNAPEVTAG